MHTESSQWSAVRQRGNRLGFWFFETALRLFGLRGSYGLLYIVCAYYLVFDYQAVRAALAYLRRRFPSASRLRLLGLAYRLLISQGRTLIDRHYLVSGLGAFDFEFRGREKAQEILNDKSKGFVLLTAHVGNWQVVMSAIRGFNRRVCLLMRPEDNPAVRDSLAVGGSGSESVRIVSPDAFLGGVLEMMSLLRQGWLVSVMGDRSYGANAIEAPFLGQPARFPLSAFHLAACAECPLIVLLTAKLSTARYLVDVAAVFHPRYAPGVPKKDQARGWVASFAGLLERYTAEFPLQCFLFHDVWADVSNATNADVST